ncbi:MAG: NifB/NifX family molybdenum-iron cluster-binding protein [Saccharofermentanales bacterium]
MKIAIPVDDKSEGTRVSLSFGRAPYYLIHDTETEKSEWVENTAAQSAGGAGIRAAQILVDQKTEILLSPRLGQNAADFLLEAGVRIFKTTDASAADNLRAYLAGELSPLDEIHAGLHGH